jgi:D-sedoheptulose 7-phosphate isomerase
VTSPSQQADKIEAIWDAHLEVAKALPRLASAISGAVDLIYSPLSNGGQMLIAGNGGSATDAQHIAADVTGRFLRERRPFRPLAALHTKTSSRTAVGNNHRDEHVLARELTAHARPVFYWRFPSAALAGISARD